MARQTYLCLSDLSILLIFLYGSVFWAVTKEYAWKIVSLDHWCLQRLLGIKWCQLVSNAEVRWRTSRSLLTSTVESRRLFLLRACSMNGQ